MQQNNRLKISYHGASDVGLVRTENQDSFGKFPTDSDDQYQNKGLLFLIADGMGGHVGGREASQSAVGIVSREYYSFSSDLISNCLKYAFKTANFRIHQSSREELQSHRMGTTCTALVIEKDLAYIAHVGDSRIYRITTDQAQRLTNDHTQVEEMFRKGILSREEAQNHPSKSILVRALGIESDVEIDVIEKIQIKPGDNFVLCSDGLAKVNKEEIKGIVLSNSPSDACTELIKLANDRGGHDNVTVQVIRIEDDRNQPYYPQQTKQTQKPKKNWIWLIVIAAVISLIIILALLFQKNLTELFRKEDNSEIQTPNDVNLPAEESGVEYLFAQANQYLELGDLDSALVSYKLILLDNPMHVGALNGVEVIADKFTMKGNLNKQQRNFSAALENYQRAAELKPNDNNIAGLIADCKKEIKKESELEINSGTDKGTDDRNSMPDQNQTVEQNNPDLILSSFLKSDWNFENINDKDYSIDSEILTFFSSGKLKKGIYSQNMEDVDVKVSLLLPNKSANECAGIIVGYNKTDENSENYYLFSTDIFGNFLLRKFLNGQEEKLVSVQKEITPVNDTYRYNLKIKCLGPWIMIYNNDKLLESFLNKDFVKGRIGLFAESGTNAEFSEFKVTSAFENREKNKLY